MALLPDNEQHAKQIEAGTTGRNRGHKFEKLLTDDLNSLDWSLVKMPSQKAEHLVTGHPAVELVRYIAQRKQLSDIKAVRAWWVGGLATSGQGDTLTDEEGNPITKCKSDVVIEIRHAGGVCKTGVSVKTCSKKTPTNAQLYFTTASRFCQFLRENGIPVTQEAESALRMFCGDPGYRPLDNPDSLIGRKSDPERFFWEELPPAGLAELERIFTEYQDEITQLLLQKAYHSDPYPPEFVLHQTVKYSDMKQCTIALFTVEELVRLSRQYNGFHKRPYYVRKGRFKGDPNEHQAPRFGFVQFQRGGQKQHPTQLQFNLQAGYFHKI